MKDQLQIGQIWFELWDDGKHKFVKVSYPLLDYFFKEEIHWHCGAVIPDDGLDLWESLKRAKIRDVQLTKEIRKDER